MPAWVYYWVQHTFSDDFWLEHFEMEFGTHILWFHSPHEYFKTAEYEQQTRSLSAPTRYHLSVIPTV